MGYVSLSSLLPLALSIMFGVAGQLLLKWVAVHVIGTSFGWLYLLQLGAALVVYSLGVVNWIFALRHLRLSVAYPVTSLSYVGILWGSYYWFGEEITVTRGMGVGLIFLGVLLVVMGLPTLSHVRHRK
jgi:multidrug transporter EmrE-like cation transporter